MIKFYSNIKFKKALQQLKNEIEDEVIYEDMKHYRNYTWYDVLMHTIYYIIKWVIILFLVYTVLLSYSEVWTKETLPTLCNSI